LCTQLQRGEDEEKELTKRIHSWTP
jgi:hypothetical protein